MVDNADPPARRWSVPVVVAGISVVSMTGDLVFGVLPQAWAATGWAVAAALVGGATFALSRREAPRAIAPPAAYRPRIDQLKPAPVLVGRAEVAEALYLALVAPRVPAPEPGRRGRPGDPDGPGGADGPDGPDGGSGPPHRQANVVVVYGAAGTGKTTLAMHAAHRVKGNFPDARLYIDLQGDVEQAVSSGAALEHLLRSLGVAAADIPRGTGDRAAMFRHLAAPLRMLLLLDNARSTEQVAPLLPAGADCTVLVTSRRSLTVGDLTQRHLIHVPLPQETDALALLGYWAGGPRVGEDPDSAKSIVELCGRLPLALKIVGTRLRSRADLTPERMRARLADEGRRLGELAFDEASLDACLLLSYQDLPEDARLLLGAAAVLPRGRLTDWHAERIGADGVAVDELVATGLLDAEPRDGRTTYHLHDLVRVFATAQYARMAPERRRAAVRGLVRGYRDAAVRLAALRAPELARQEAAELASTMDGLPAAEWFAAEAERLVWAHDAAENGESGEDGGQGEAAALLGECAAYFLEDVAVTRERVARLFADRPALPTTPASARQRAARVRVRAALLLAGHDFTGALAALAADGAGGAGGARRVDGDPYAAARALSLIARVEREQGRIQGAAHHMAQAVEQLRALGDAWHLGLALEVLGEIHRLGGRPADGEAAHREALRIAEDFGDPRAQARLRRTLAETLAYQREFTEATELLRSSLAGFRALGDRWGEARVLLALGKVQRPLGDRLAALDSLQQALRLFEQFDDGFWPGRVHHALIRVQAGLGHQDLAYEAARSSLDLFERTGHSLWHSYALRDLGWLYLHDHRAAEAVPLLGEAVRASEAAGDVFAEAQARNLLGVALREDGRHDDALRELELARAAYRAAGSDWYDAVCAHDLVHTLRRAGRAAEADRLAHEAAATNPAFTRLSGRDGAVSVPEED